jgi:hypothetical protein
VSKLPGGSKNFLSIRQKCFFERRGVRHGSVEGSDSDKRAIEIVKGFFAENGSDFAGDAASFGVFVNNQAFIGFLHGLEDGFLVEGEKGAQIDNFGVDAFFGESVGGFKRRLREFLP